LKVKCDIDYQRSLAKWLIFHEFYQWSWTQANMSTGPELTMIYKHSKFSKWNQIRLKQNWHDISPAFSGTITNTGYIFVPYPQSLGYNIYNHAVKIS
jgi:hypothetical protein